MADAIEAAALAIAKVIARRHLDREPTEKDIQYWMSEARYEEVKAALAAADAARLKDAPMIASIQSRHNATLAYVASGELSYETAFLIAHADRAQLLDRATAQAARIEALEKAFEEIGVGGNHLAASLIALVGADFAEKLPPDTDADMALHELRSSVDYDMWMCWAAIMRARATLEGK